MNVIQEVETSGEGDATEKNGGESYRPAPLQILDNVEINIDPETPVSTLENVVISTSTRSEPTFRKDGLLKAEKKLRKAFVEFHGQLRLLKSFR